MLKSSEINKIYIINDLVEFIPSKGVLYNKKEKKEITMIMPSSLCLLHLILNEGTLQEHDAIFSAVWGEKKEYVSQSSLYQAILNLRNALKEAGLPREIIITFARRGFMLDPNIIINEGEKSKETDEVKINEPPPAGLQHMLIQKIVVGCYSFLKAPLALAFILSGFLIYLLLLNHSLFTMTFSDYSIRKVYKVDNRTCIIHEKKGNDELTPLEIKIIDSVCNNNHIYIPSINFSERVNIFTCPQPATGKYNNCSSNYIWKSE